MDKQQTTIAAEARRRMMLGMGEDVPYISDGLVFWLDGIDKGADDGSWVDLVGGIVLRGVDYTPIVLDNGFKLLNGKSMNSIDFPIGYVGGSVYTIEACINYAKIISAAYQYGSSVTFNRTSSGFGEYPNIGVGSRDQKRFSFMQRNGTLQSMKYGSLTFDNKPHTLSFSKDLGYIDLSIGVSGSAGAIEGQYFRGVTLYALAKSNSYDVFHSVRLYNRILTEEEVLHNQQIDNERFNLGL